MEFPAPASRRACGFNAVRRSSGHTKRSGRQLAAGRILQKPRPQRARCSACARCFVTACHLRSSSRRRLHHQKGHYKHGKRAILFARSQALFYACTTRPALPASLYPPALDRPIPNRTRLIDGLVLVQPRRCRHDDSVSSHLPVHTATTNTTDH